MKKIYNTTHIQQKGFTLLFAILVSTLVVSIGASIVSIALRQTILSGTSRESNYAFYAANTVLECAVYWDKFGANESEQVVFPVPTTSDTLVSNTDDLTCAGVNIATGAGNNNKTWENIVFTSNGDERTFYIKIKDQLDIRPGGQKVFNGDGYCAQATVIKSAPDPTTGVVTTRIEARGYNTCDTTNPRRVERGLIEEYQS